MKQIIRFLNSCKKYKKKLVVCLIMQLVFSVFALALPETSRRSINAIQHMDLQSLKSAVLIAVVSAIVCLSLAAIIKIQQQKINNRCLQDIQVNLLNKFISVKKEKYKDFTLGDIITNVINNCASAVDNSLDYLFDTWSGIVVVIVGIIYMGFVEWKLMLCIVAYNVLIRILMKFFGDKIKDSSSKSVNTIKVNNSFLVDILKNMMTISVFNKIEYFIKILTKKETNTLKTSVKQFAWSNTFFEFIWTSLRFAEFFVVYGFGGYLVYKGQTSIGTLLAFTFAIDMFVVGINSISYGVSEKNVALANIELINEVLDISQLEDEPSTKLNDNNFIVRFNNVSFNFAEKKVLHDVNFEINYKEKILIKGPNGMGKSTLLNLLAGLYRPLSGEILYGDYNISSINLDEIIKKYSYISQNSNIVTENVYENIALSSDYQKLKCDEILKSLNLEKIVNTNSKMLSQGEKQRLNIGRAIYKAENVTFILGDEIFSNIDAENTKKIVKFLFTTFADKTIVMVCHENIDYDFDKILYVDNGTVKVENTQGAYSL